MDTPVHLLPEPLPVVLTDGSTVMTYVMGSELSHPVGDVVFCHGTPWSAQVWADAAWHLSAGFRVFLWDMPGYGRSTKDLSVALDLASQMSRLAELLERWNLERPNVVAHDVGGAVALGAHLLHGREFGSLFLWDIVTLDPWGSAFFRLVADHAQVFSALPPNLHAALVEEYIAGAAHHRLDPEWLVALCAPWLEPGGQSGFYRQIASLRAEHTRPIVERLGEVRCRTAIGWGQDDPWIPVGQATQLRELLPANAPMHILPQVGHLAPIEAGSQVRAALGEWLTSQ